MLPSLSSVPPVWPRPWPEIIGTKPPHAATIGARIRLTLSPMPPVECLSRTGPSGPASDQARTVPNKVMTRHGAEAGHERAVLDKHYTGRIGEGQNSTRMDTNHL